MIRWMLKSVFVRVLVGFGVAALVLWGVGLLVTGPYKNWVAGFDSNIRYFMRQIQSPMWTALLLTLTKLGSTIYLIIIGSIAGIAFLILRWFRPFILFVITMAGQAALHYGFKWLIARPRPSALINYHDVDGSSFPSGHAIAAACMFGSVAWLVATRLDTSGLKVLIAIFACVLVFLIAMSRVYIGIHYPTDVVAGLVAGAIWTAAVMSVDRRTL
jgi:undecaprenyl-diphosphatase